MPRLFGDEYEKDGRLSLTSLQYSLMNKWLNNLFTVDDISNTKPKPGITAAGLDQAALENCIGGPFYPGIEAGWFVRDKYVFIEPYRLDTTGIIPGDVTRQMALPWQADFWACAKEPDNLTTNPNDKIGWWPFARPDDVFAENATTQVPWTPPADFPTYDSMVEKWMKLGFVIEKNNRFVEVQRQV